MKVIKRLQREIRIKKKAEKILKQDIKRYENVIYLKKNENKKLFDDRINLKAEMQIT